MYFILVREMYFLSSVLKFLAYVAFLRFYALNEDFFNNEKQHILNLILL